MKSVWTKLLCMLLCVCMLVIPFAACNDDGEASTEGASQIAEATQGEQQGEADTTVGDTDGTGKVEQEAQTNDQNVGSQETEAPETEPPVVIDEVEKKDYKDASFTAVYCQDIFQKGYFFVDEDNRQEGNDLDDRLYEREILVEEYLNVDIVPIDGGSYTDYTTNFEMAVISGTDDYQMLMTHAYYGLSKLITTDILYDMSELESLNLQADYWNEGMMEELAVDGAMYLGYNDFCLAHTMVITFNKTMYEPFVQANGDLYQLVRDSEWTLDKMMETASLINEEGDSATKRYGFVGFAWVPFISFETASDIKIADRDENGDFYVVASNSKNNAKLVLLHEKLFDFCKENYVYAYAPGELAASAKVPTTPITLDEERSLLSLASNYDLVTLAGTGVKFGVLPYPKYEKTQESYRHLNWNGYVAVASSIKNEEMVSDVMEVLAWYSAPVKTVFYEKLLGKKIANAPDDAEMLEIVWKTQVTDVGLVYSSVHSSMDTIVYAIPQCICLYDQRELTSFIRSAARTANKQLQGLFAEE